jgi:hypothetical protein
MPGVCESQTITLPAQNLTSPQVKVQDPIISEVRVCSVAKTNSIILLLSLRLYNIDPPCELFSTASTIPHTEVVIIGLGNHPSGH